MGVYETLQQTLRARCPELELRAEESMAQNTTFHIGGPVRLMAVPKTEGEAVCAVKTAYEMGITPVFMGNGSNLLVSDGGVEAFLIKTSGLQEMALTGECEITAGSGVTLAALAGFALQHGLTGLEFAQGIPGTLGGAITMNAGAYGGEMKQVAAKTIYLTEDGQWAELVGQAQDFSYRHSAFSDKNNLIIRVVLSLQKGDPALIGSRMEELRRKRRESQPLEYPSAGSMFKRPASGYAAAMIDAAGLKGLAVGGAQVSEKHAGFVINRGGATCADVLELVSEVQRRVEAQTGVRLEMEVKTLGV